MKLTFHGTKGEIDATSRRHSALEVAYRGRAVLADCGEDWRGRLDALDPKAIVLTHAHPDHAGGLKDGAPCPVWATARTWERIDPWPIEERRIVEPRSPFEVRGIGFEAFPVEHSIRAPAVGYRIEAGEVAIFYAPDLVDLPENEAALGGVDAYVADGASIDRSIVRTRDGVRIGHVSVKRQLEWCEEIGVPRMIVTHCGSQIVKGDERSLGPRLARLGAGHGVEAEIAHDGMEIVLR